MQIPNDSSTGELLMNESSIGNRWSKTASSIQSLLDSLRCPLCSELMKEPSGAGRCAHMFCYNCILHHCSDSRESLCPDCKEPFWAKNIQVHHEIKHIVELCLEMLPKLEGELNQSFTGGNDILPSLKTDENLKQEVPLHEDISIEEDSNSHPLYFTPPESDEIQQKDADYQSNAGLCSVDNKDEVAKSSSCVTVDLQQDHASSNMLEIFEDDSAIPVLDLDNESSKDSSVNDFTASPTEIIQKSQHVRPVEKTYVRRTKRKCLNTRQLSDETSQALLGSKIGGRSRRKWNTDEGDEKLGFNLEDQSSSKHFEAQVAVPTTPVAQVKKRCTIAKTPSSTPGSKKNKMGETPLHRVCKTGNLNKLKELMAETDMDINAKDNFGWTPLHEACIHKHTNCVQYLLKNGADANAQADNNDTPLHDACSQNCVDIVKLLLDFGACKTLKNNDGHTPTHFVSSDTVQALLDSATDPKNLSITGLRNPLDEYQVECPVVAYSGVQGDEMSKLQKMKLSFKTDKDVSSGTTHLVCEVDENLVCKRTLKFFKAMALGIPIVSKAWMVESANASKWLPISQFIVLKSSGNREKAPEESFVHLFQGKPRLLTGLSVFVDTSPSNSTMMNKQVLGELVRISGGNLMKRLPRKGSGERNVTRVYHAPNGSEFQSQPFIVISEPSVNVPVGFVVKSPNWLLDCIANYKLES